MPLVLLCTLFTLSASIPFYPVVADNQTQLMLVSAFYDVRPRQFDSPIQLRIVTLISGSFDPTPFDCLWITETGVKRTAQSVSVFVHFEDIRYNKPWRTGIFTCSGPSLMFDKPVKSVLRANRAQVISNWLDLIYVGDKVGELLEIEGSVSETA